jgi:UDP-2-acetamido-2-deoxy-ribo-hexuluronate aminotransferase
VKLIDLEAQQARIRAHIDRNIRCVLDHGQYIMGPEIKTLEERLRAYVGVKHAVACASGTDALLMGLMAYGLGPGDAVFTSPFTFIATAEVIRILGAVPVFVDIDPQTFNMDPEKLETAIAALKRGNAKLHPLPRFNATPRGIIAVNLFGLPCDYDPIRALSHQNDLFVIEDAAQSFGAEYQKAKSCRLAHLGCTSFFPAKPLGCYGDGGMCFTDDDDLAQKLDSIRIHGKGSHKYDNVRIGINGRLDTLQAAILLAKLEIFSEEVLLRQTVAQRYSEGLRHSHGVSVPFIPDGRTSVWAQYSLLAQNEQHRADLQDRLKQAGIPTAVYYPRPLHLQSAFADLGYVPGDFPVSEACSRRIFSIPMHPYLTAEDQRKIVETITSG